MLDFPTPFPFRDSMLYSGARHYTLTGEQGWRCGESARLPPMCPGFDSLTRCHMWVEFVVASLLCSERFFSGYCGFPLSSKPKFKFDPDYCRALYHKPLARMIAQAIPVFDVKFTFSVGKYIPGDNPAMSLHTIQGGE